jgi:hypothetical protein
LKIAANLIPIPIPVNQSHIVQAIKVAMNVVDNIGAHSINDHQNDHDVLVARKKGILHHLKPVVEVLDKRRAAKEIKCYLTKSRAKKSSKASSYHKIISALDKSGLCVTGLIVETADNDVDTEHISLGAAVLICKKEKRGSWVLTASNCDEIFSNELGNFDDAKFVRCHLDEMLGIHIATSIPIVISSSLFLRKSVSGLLKSEAVEGEKDDVETKIHAPYFDTNDIKSKRWYQNLYSTRVKRPKGVKKVYEIENADDFLNMTIGEKRYIMRASGIFDLPRPREGPAAVDAMIVPLLQKKVLHKVMRQLNWTKSEFMRAKILQRQIDTDAVKADVRPQQSCCFFVIDRNRSHRNHLKSSGMPPNKEQISETSIYDPRSVTIFEGDVEKYDIGARSDDKFYLTNTDTGGKILLTREEKERVFMDALQLYYVKGESALSDIEFDALKTDLSWEGSMFVTLNKDEVLFLSAVSAYNSGESILTDQEFDALKKTLRENDSKIAVQLEPKCYIDTGVCKVTWRKEETLTASLYFPAALVNSLVYIGVTFELANNFLHVAVNPIILLITGTIPIWSLSKLLTENFLFRSPLVVVGKCPSCSSYNKAFFGDVLLCEGDMNESTIKCTNCKELVTIRRSNLRVSSLNTKNSVSHSR